MYKAFTLRYRDGRLASSESLKGKEATEAQEAGVMLTARYM